MAAPYCGGSDIDKLRLDKVLLIIQAGLNAVPGDAGDDERDWKTVQIGLQQALHRDSITELPVVSPSVGKAKIKISRWDKVVKIWLNQNGAGPAIADRLEKINALIHYELRSQGYGDPSQDNLYGAYRKSDQAKVFFGDSG